MNTPPYDSKTPKTALTQKRPTLTLHADKITHDYLGDVMQWKRGGVVHIYSIPVHYDPSLDNPSP